MTPGMPDLYTACANAIMEERGKPWSRIQEGRPPRLYVSDLDVVLGMPDGKCYRRLWHEVRDAPREPINPGTALMFHNGDRLHELFVEYFDRLEDQGWKVTGVEVRCQPDEEGEIGGRLDVELTHQETGYVLIVDFKTKRGNAFRYLTEPKPGNVLQVQTYIHARRREGFRADGGCILYIDREGQNFIQQYPEPGMDPIPPNPELVEKAIRCAKKIRDMEEPPPIIPPKLTIGRNKGPDSVKVGQRWQADYCPLAECPCQIDLPSGIVGYLDDGRFTPKDDTPPEITELVRDLLHGEQVGLK